MAKYKTFYLTDEDIMDVITGLELLQEGLHPLEGIRELRLALIDLFYYDKDDRGRYAS